MNVLILLLIAVLIICFITCMNGFVLILLITGITIVSFKWLNGLTILLIALIEIVLVNKLLHIKRFYKVLLSCFIVLCVIGIFHYYMNKSYYLAKIEYNTHKEAYENMIQYFGGHFKQTDVVYYILAEEEKVFIITKYKNGGKTKEEISADTNSELYSLLTDLYGKDVKYFKIFFDEEGNIAARFDVKREYIGQDAEGTEKYIVYSLYYWEPEYSGDSPSAGTREYCMENTHLKGNWYAWSKKYLAG